MNSESFTENEKFETMLRNYFEADVAFPVSAETNVFSDILSLFGIFRGEVVISAFDNEQLAGDLQSRGFSPVFADIDPRSFVMSASEIMRHLSSETVCVIFSHKFGLCCPIEEISASLREKGILILEDARDALGSVRFCGGLLRAGSAGDAAVAKIGGLTVVVFKNAPKNIALSPADFEFDVSEAVSALLSNESSVERRQMAAQRYKLLFGEKGLLRFVKIPKVPENGIHVYTSYAVRCERKDELAEFLRSRGTETKSDFSAACGFANAELAANTVLTLPPCAEEEEQVRTAEEITSFYRGNE